MRDFLWEGFDEMALTLFVGMQFQESRVKDCQELKMKCRKNRALLAKWIWRFPLEKETLWHLVIRSKATTLMVGILMWSTPGILEALGKQFQNNILLFSQWRMEMIYHICFQADNWLRIIFFCGRFPVYIGFVLQEMSP